MTDSTHEQWKLDVNDRYHKVVDVIIGLATASLILPVLFLRTMMGAPEDNLWEQLTPAAFLSAGFFAASITCGLLFSYVSAKWIKQAWRQPTLLSEKTLHRWLDILFMAMTVSFLLGLLLFGVFAKTVFSRPATSEAGSHVPDATSIKTSRHGHQRSVHARVITPPVQ